MRRQPLVLMRAGGKKKEFFFSLPPLFRVLVVPKKYSSTVISFRDLDPIAPSIFQGF